MQMITAGPFAGYWRNGYGVILADPPWRDETWGEVNGRAPPYPTMSEEELWALPVHEVAAPSAHLMMWTTAQHLRQSLHLGRRWGFRYSSIFQTWVKLNKNGTPWISMGKTTRKQTELCLLFRRGDPRRHDASIGELIAWDGEELDTVLATLRGEHSVKPEEVRNRIDRYADPRARKLEIFARRNDHENNGWSYWGNQQTLYNGTPTL